MPLIFTSQYQLSYLIERHYLGFRALCVLFFPRPSFLFHFQSSLPLLLFLVFGHNAEIIFVSLRAREKTSPSITLQSFDYLFWMSFSPENLVKTELRSFLDHFQPGHSLQWLNECSNTNMQKIPCLFTTVMFQTKYARICCQVYVKDIDEVPGNVGNFLSSYYISA